jgi:hypothetical protein
MKSTTTTITRPSDKHREFTELETALETVTRLRRNLRDLEEKKSKAVLHAIRNDGINPGADMIPIVGPLDSLIDATQEELDGALSEIDALPPIIRTHARRVVWFFG